MKKILLSVILFVFISACFTGCEAKPYVFKESIDEIESIEIVNVVANLEFTVLKTLSETEENDFLEQFQAIEFRDDYIGDPPTLYGKAIKINYLSGGYEMIGSNRAVYVKNDEKDSARRCDKEIFNKLLNSFLEEEISK